MDTPKIFGIGLPKTGTTSLAKALTMFGFRTVHYHGLYARCHGLDRLTKADQRFDDADAFIDAPIYQHWYRLRILYPQAKFILTTRKDLQEWMNSCLIHVLYSRKVKPDATWQWDDINTAAFLQTHVRHLENVRRAFGGDPNFLEIDLCDRGTSDTQRWDRLAKFFDLEAPQGAFPREQSGRQKLQALIEAYSAG